jgi:hypothetical protein
VSDQGCSAAFQDLFDAPHLNVIDVRADESVELSDDDQVFRSHEWFRQIWIKHGAAASAWERFHSEARECARLMTPVAKIGTAINAFASAHDLDKACGVHIRQTDNVYAYDYFEKNSPSFSRSQTSSIIGFEAYVEQTVNRADGKLVFLATDNRKVEQRLLGRFSGSVVCYPKEYSTESRGRCSSIQDAVIEMILLSKCSSICGTYFSSFSKFAAWLGDCEYLEVQGDNIHKSDFNELLKRPVK